MRESEIGLLIHKFRYSILFLDQALIWQNFEHFMSFVTVFPSFFFFEMILEPFCPDTDPVREKLSSFSCPSFQYDWPNEWPSTKLT